MGTLVKMLNRAIHSKPRPNSPAALSQELPGQCPHACEAHSFTLCSSLPCGAWEREQGPKGRAAGGGAGGASSG